ncbi:hypothetical protein TNCV_58681 [Trichonephila clavipes]|nr:hypothetical protein TNCV_58681 [Trichonephila clavipes]
MIPPAHKAHQTVSFSGCNGVSTYTCGLASLQMRQFCLLTCYQGYIGPTCDQEEEKTEGCGLMCVALIALSALLGLSIFLNIFILCKYRLNQ